LEREARAIARLSHPNICTLFEFGSHEGLEYLAMEYLDGETLLARLARGPLPWKDALEIAIALARALETAHAAGVVHRDIKPGNIMLTSYGPKLLDFGLARREAPPAGAPRSAEGTVVGTLEYMSPEQLEGGVCDARSDLWSLGATLHEVLTGRKPF